MTTAPAVYTTKVIERDARGQIRRIVESPGSEPPELWGDLFDPAIRHLRETVAALRANENGGDRPAHPEEVEAAAKLGTLIECLDRQTVASTESMSEMLRATEDVIDPMRRLGLVDDILLLERIAHALRPPKAHR